MPIDSITVAARERLIQTLGDPGIASQLAAVFAPGDAIAMAGRYALLGLDVSLLLNPAGSFDQQRAAVGTTGVAAVNTEGTKPTYSVGVIGFTPVAPPPDFWSLAGSATKTIRLLRLSISGTATAGSSMDTQLIKRTTA